MCRAGGRLPATTADKGLDTTGPDVVSFQRSHRSFIGYGIAQQPGFQTMILLPSKEGTWNEKA
jgi:hypothetical protein